MVKTVTINVRGTNIAVTKINEDDYISLTDMVKNEEGEDHIRNWMRNKNTIEFLGIWEKINNPEFKGVEFDTFLKEAGLNRFNMTPRKWIDTTGAIGIVSKSGRNGGTYAHKDIAFEFGAWISPIFKLYLIKEFQRLKEEEQKNVKSAEWLFHRFSTKANYTIQTDAIQQHIIPTVNLPKEKLGIVYASEAELINYGTLGYTAKQWEKENPQLVLSGKNLRDYLSVEELIVLDNMQSFNSYLISQHIPQEERLKRVQDEAKRQLSAIKQSRTIQNIHKEETKHLPTSLDGSLKKALDYNPNEEKEPSK